MSNQEKVKKVKELGKGLRAIVYQIIEDSFSEYFKNEHHSSNAYYSAYYIEINEGWGSHVTPTETIWKEQVLRDLSLLRSCFFPSVPEEVDKMVQAIEAELNK